MARKKKNVKANGDIKYAGIRFNPDTYVEIGADLDDFSNSTVTSDIDGVVTKYSLGGGTPERKRLYTNPDTSIQQGSVTLFNTSEDEGYKYLIFTITNTAGDYDVEEWCELEPLKAHAGQFVVSYPINNKLLCRKIYRTQGTVKTSVNVYNLGTTEEDRNGCIVKYVDAVKEG